MRNLNELDEHRLRTEAVKCWFGGFGDDTCGVFSFQLPDNVELFLIACALDGWDHISVSTRHRCPTWEEMDFVKRKFFKDDEMAMQLHPPAGEHANLHPFTLHLWRPHGAEIPKPHIYMV